MGAGLPQFIPVHHPRIFSRCNRLYPPNRCGPRSRVGNALRHWWNACHGGAFHEFQDVGCFFRPRHLDIHYGQLRKNGFATNQCHQVELVGYHLYGITPLALVWRKKRFQRASALADPCILLSCVAWLVPLRSCAAVIIQAPSHS